MVENRHIEDKRRILSSRSRNQGQTMTSPRTSISNKNAETNRCKKNVFFESSDDKDTTDSSSSNGSEVRTNTDYNISLTRPARLSTHSIRSSGRNSSSSNGSESCKPSLRPTRSASTPASTRSSRGTSRSSDGITPRPLSRARMSSRSSLVSFDGPNTPRNYSKNKKRERMKQRCDSIDSLDSEGYSPREVFVAQPISPELIALTEQSKLAWDQFSTHVKLIDDSTDLISRRPRKTFTSSGIFQKAMEDLYGSPEYWKSRGVLKFQNQVGAIAKFASKFIVGARRVKAKHENISNNDDEELFLEYVPSKETVENAQRGWKILRQYVQEMAAEKRMSQTTLTWDMLRHTIKGISNMERARMDLYQRYGLIPMIKNDGTVVQENTMLSERARSAISAKSKPLTLTPTKQTSSNANRKMSKAYASIEGFSGTGLRLDLYL